MNQRFIFFIILTGIISAYVFIYPFLLKILGILYVRMNNIYSPGPFRAEIFRILFAFATLFIPGFIIAGVFPVLIRLSVRHVGHTGLSMSTFIASGSTGALFGILLSCFFLIPSLGIRTAYVFCAALYLVIMLFTLYVFLNKTVFLSHRSKSSSPQRSVRASMRFKKDKAILEIISKLDKTVLYVFFFHGFAIASLMFIYLRLIQYFRVIKTAFFYTEALIIIITGVIIGSILYKRISERPVNKYLTLATLQIITGFVSVFSYVLLFFMSDYQHHYLSNFTNINVLLLKQTFPQSLLLFLPSLMTGLYIPLAGKIYPKRLQKSGGKIGNLGFIWLIGATCGILLTPFLLIPLTGVHFSVILLACGMVLSGIYLIFRDSRLIRGFRIGYIFTVIILYIIVIAAINIFHIRLPKRSTGYAIEGSTAEVCASEQADGGSVVSINGKPYFSTDSNSIKYHLLPAYIPLLMNSPIQSALVVGFGSGITANALENSTVPNIYIVEKIPEMIRLSSDVFAEENNDILTNRHVTIITEDIRSYVNRSDRKVNLITSGCDNVDLMPASYTMEYYKLCFGILSDQGILCQIFSYDQLYENDLRSILHSCSEVFPEVSLWYLCPGKLLAVASKNKLQFDYCNVRANLMKLSQQRDFNLSGLQNTEAFLALMVADNKQLRNYVSDAPWNSDNKPFVKFNLSDSKATNGISLLMKQPAVVYDSLITFGSKCDVDKYSVISTTEQINASIREQLILSSVLDP
jgi:spermidine synthase